MIDVATAAMGLGVWWASVCRIGLMTWRTHRAAVILLHWMAGAVGLVMVGQSILGQADALAASTAGALLLVVAATVSDWRNGPPSWAIRRA